MPPPIPRGESMDLLAEEARLRRSGAFTRAIEAILAGLLATLQLEVDKAFTTLHKDTAGGTDANRGVAHAEARDAFQQTDALGERTLTDLNMGSSDALGHSPQLAASATMEDPSGPALALHGFSPSPKPPRSQAPRERETGSRGGSLCGTRSPGGVVVTVPVTIHRSDLEEAAARLAAALLLHGSLYSTCQSLMAADVDAGGGGGGDADASDAPGPTTSISRLPEMIRASAVEEECASCLAGSLLDYCASSPPSTPTAEAESRGGSVSLYKSLAPLLVRAVAMEACRMVSVVLCRHRPWAPGGDKTISSTPAAAPALPHMTLLPSFPHLPPKHQEEIAAILGVMGCSTSTRNLDAYADVGVTFEDVHRDWKFLASLNPADVEGDVGEEEGGTRTSSPRHARRSRSRVPTTLGVTLNSTTTAAVHATAAATLRRAVRHWSVVLTHPYRGVGGSGATQGPPPLTVSEDSAVAPIDSASLEDAEAYALRRLFCTSDEADAMDVRSWVTATVEATCREVTSGASRPWRHRPPDGGNASHMMRLGGDTTLASAQAYEMLHGRQMIPQALVAEAVGAEHESESADKENGSASAVPPFTRTDAETVVNPFLHVPCRKRTRFEEEEEMFPQAESASWLPLASPLATPGLPAQSFRQEVLALTSEDDAVDMDAETAEALEEVGAVLASVDRVLSARTLMDSSAWRYGRNRVSVAAGSTVFLSRDAPAGSEKPSHTSAAAEEMPSTTAPSSDVQLKVAAQDVGMTSSSFQDKNDTARLKTEELSVGTTADRRGPSPQRGSSDTSEESSDTEDALTSEVWVPYGLYMHETGVFYNTAGSTFLLDVETPDRW